MGSGLVRAYRLESSIAIYPRIIIAPEIENIMEEMCGIFILTRDFDGIYFVDPYVPRRSKDIEGFINEFIIDNEKRIELNAGNYKVLQTLNWLQNYFYSKENIIKNSNDTKENGDKNYANSEK